MLRHPAYIVIAVVIIGMIVWLSWPAKKTTAPTTNTVANTSIANTNATVNTNTSTAQTQTFSTADLPDRDPAFEFTMNIPKTWRVEYIATTKAINIYDPSLTGTAVDKSQLFIQYYVGKDFKDSSRAIDPVEDTTIANGNAVHQQNLSASGAASAMYPAWLVQAHQLTDIRTGTKNPYTFYSVHAAPTISNDMRSTVLNSLSFDNGTQPM